MGIFWADEQPAKQPEARPPVTTTGTYYDWLWAHPVPQKYEAAIPKPSKCPVDHTKLQKKSQAPVQAEKESKCPVDHTKLQKKPVDEASKCPVDHTKLQKNGTKLNPDNMMPELAQTRVPGQKINLPTSRTVSSIPKGSTEGSGNWEYPSPQQMLNAMVRKSGPDGIEEDAVESMVDVHNFLNEGVWDEVLEWEDKYTERSHIQPRLLQFQGRPQEMSPRAQMIQLLGKVFPKTWGCPPPFDRHDWTVLRAETEGEWKKVRYVIDFYEAPDEGDMPAFSVDVRPAADNVENIKDRILHATVPVWNKAMGWEDREGRE